MPVVAFPYAVAAARAAAPRVLMVVLMAAILPAAAASGHGLPDLPEAWAAGRADALAICMIPSAPSAATPAQASLLATFAHLRREPSLGRPLLDRATRRGVGVCLDAYERGCDGVYDCDANVVLLDADLSSGLREAILVHELRHMDRAAAGYVLDLRFDVHAARTLACAGEADAQAVATWFAWRRAQQGDRRAWRALLAHRRYGDIARAFAAAIALGADEREAARVAFDRWYASAWRVETYRLSAAMSYLDRIDEQHAFVSFERLPDDYFTTFDVLPDGTSYGALPRRLD